MHAGCTQVLDVLKGRLGCPEGAVSEHISAGWWCHQWSGLSATLSSLPLVLCRLNDPKMSEAERQSMESERADCSLFVQELLLSTLMQEESSSSDEDERGEIADFGAMGCVDIMPLDVALENLNLKESNKGNEPPPPPLWWHPTLQTMSSVLYLPMKVDNNYLGFVLVIVISGLSLLLHCVHSKEREKRYIW